ncbi:hypothetical protein Nepgr_012954 [Nepenthes gracilis]|uniref:Uncharacterized protein n=1 Tax=Nepenthes gracilis TaxID=150966 RepID=A0AAD3XNJ5_NEPGR|nr:hypothetical protein Nepgr_012954 [Nepenthes gracilis]
MFGFNRTVWWLLESSDAGEEGNSIELSRIYMGGSSLKFYYSPILLYFGLGSEHSGLDPALGDHRSE